MQRPDQVASAIGIWKKLAHQLIPIIGEGGFQSLYERSLYLTSITSPWIAEGHSLQTDFSFANLKTSLKSRNSTEATETNIVLLLTFLDILASLIGNVLTESILRSTWGDDG